MKEISLHILDIVQNSLAANADLIEIIIKENIEENMFKLQIIDNGSGIEEKNIDKVLDPFVTERKTRDVGLGLPFLKKAAENCNGFLEINSETGKGTVIEVVFEHNHIDRAPLGDITGTIISLITTNPDIDFIYHHIIEDKEFKLNTKEIKKDLDDIDINHPQIIGWLEEYIKENLHEIR